MDDVAVHSSQNLVGRDAELAEIASLLGVRPATGEPGHVLLSGDAGVGKTRLLTELRDLAFTEGWQVVAGHCLDFGDSALPYLPFSEVLGRLATDRPEVVDRVAADHPALARLQPGRRVLSARERGEGAEGGESLDRSDLFAAVHALLGAAAAQAPVLLVVEDTHWADQSTRDLVSFLFSRPFDGPVSVVVSYRSDDLHRRHPLRRQVAEWSRLRGVDRIQLAPLPDDAVRALVAELAPDGVGAAEMATIVGRAEGNAFFVEELVGAAAGPNTWLPDDLAGVLLVRLDRLDDRTRQVVRAASVAGRTVSHDMLAAASGLAPEALEEGVRQAVEMNVLIAGAGRYSFRHALLGEAVYYDLLPGERVRLHAQYAESLASGLARGTAAELARHARLAMDLDTALAASIRAGDEAATVGGPDEAANHYQQALELLADPKRRADLAVDLSKLVVSAAEALTASGQPIRAAALIADQLALLPADAPVGWRPRLLAARADAMFVIDTDEDPLAISQEALDLVPEDAGGLRAKVLAVHARMLAGHGRLEEAQAFGLDALALAERLDLHELASEAITTLGGLKRAGPKESLRTALRDAIDRAVAAGAVQPELRGRFLLGRSYEDWGEFDEAERWFRSGIESATAAGVPWAPFGFEARWQLAWIMLVRGEWDGCLALLDVAGEQAPPVPQAMLESLLLLLQQGRGAEVGARARALRRFWGTEGAVAVHSTEAELVDAGLRRDPTAAIGIYDDAVAALGRIWHEWFSARIRLAAVAIGAVAEALPHLGASERQGLVGEVDRLHAEGHVVLDRYADPSGHWGPEGRAWVKRLDAETLRARWLAGVDPPPQEVLVETWREAGVLFEDLGHVPELARCRIALAGILRACGDAAGAREVADLARATAHGLGARPMLERLRALGNVPVRAEVDAATLTSRESEILALVAEGRSNGEIGKQLFISTKTVSVHVSHILGKLGAGGRTEAAAIGRRRGLVE